MVENYFFSIILPTYNRAHLLGRAVNSVIAQIYSEWELIIIDDGSTDNTKEVVAAITEKDARVKYFYQENAERSAARNNGISKAKGSYICFLDSDDSYTENHLQGLYDFILKTPIRKGLFFTNRIKNDLTKNEIIYSEVSFNPEKAMEFFVEKSISPGRVCVEISILKEFGFDKELVVGEDTDLWFRISCHYPSYFVAQHTFIYELHEDNSVNVKNNAYEKKLNGLKKTFNKPEGKLVPLALKRKTLSNCYFGIYKHYVARKKFLTAKLCILEAIFKYPEIRFKEKLYLLIYSAK